MGWKMLAEKLVIFNALFLYCMSQCQIRTGADTASYVDQKSSKEGQCILQEQCQNPSKGQAINKQPDSKWHNRRALSSGEHQFESRWCHSRSREQNQSVFSVREEWQNLSMSITMLPANHKHLWAQAYRGGQVSPNTDEAGLLHVPQQKHMMVFALPGS